MISTNTEVDSLKLRIPLSKVNILDANLNAHYLTINTDTGEEIENFKNSSLAIESKGIKTRFAIETQPIDSLGNKKTYLVILANSKLLKEDYFKGISLDTYKQFYKELMLLKVVYFSLDSLLDAEYTDTDFKTDQYISLSNYSKMISVIVQNAKEHKRADRGYKLYNKKTNKGIQFSHRDTTSFKENPFLKIYHKETELNNKSREFSINYLEPAEYKNLVRTEFTIKNKKHIKALGISGNTFKDLLSLTDEFKKNVLQKVVRTHTEHIIKMPKPKANKMTPTQLTYYSAINGFMNFNMSYSKIEDLLVSSIDDAVAKSRQRKAIYTVYSTFIMNSEMDKSTEEIDTFLGTIGFH